MKKIIALAAVSLALFACSGSEQTKTEDQPAQVETPAENTEADQILQEAENINSEADELLKELEQ